jgi:hypothetical protein
MGIVSNNLKGAAMSLNVSEGLLARADARRSATPLRRL